MAVNLQLLEEANRRGILPENKRKLYAEAVKRGLIGGQIQQAQAQPAQPTFDATNIDQSQFQQGSTQNVLGIGGQNDLGNSGGDNSRSFAGGSYIEPAMTLATGMVAEPVAGIAGIAAGMLPGPEGQAARAVEATREAMTFQPRTKEGKAGLQSVGETLEPVGKAFKKAEATLGDATFEATGSPALAAFSASLPTLAVEVLGLTAGKLLARTGQASKASRAKGLIAREISESVPSIDQLKDTARAIYKEIDDIGATVKPRAYDGLVRRLKVATKEGGLDVRITPKASAALDKFDELSGQGVTVTEIDTLRTVAQNVAKANEPAEAALGVAMIKTVDDFLDKAGPQALDIPSGGSVNTIQLGKKYKAARDLWGRSRRSELLEEAFGKARLQASGFENGIRTQFRSILNNKKQRKFFRKDELDAMRRVVLGGKKENIAKLIGKLGFSEGSASNFLGGAIGIGAGASVGGPVGAVIVPLIGQVSRKLAQRMTAKGAEFADQVIRAGKDGKRITNAYIKNTPKAQRSASELSELLMKTDIDLSTLPPLPLANEAGKLATRNRAALAGALAAQQPKQGELNPQP